MSAAAGCSWRHGHRGRKSDPLYTCRRTLHTGADLLTDRQRTRLAALFAADAHAEVEATWQMYQRTVAAYREPDRHERPHDDGGADHHAEHRRSQAADRTDHPGTDPEEACRRRAGLLRPPRHLQRGPTEAINGRLEHLRDPRWAPATSPTTSPGHCSRPEALELSSLHLGSEESSTHIRRGQSVIGLGHRETIGVPASGQPVAHLLRTQPHRCCPWSYPPRTHAANSS